MPKPYNLPENLEKLMEGDKALQKIRHEGESNNRPIEAFYQAAMMMLVSRQHMLLRDLGRYRALYGNLPEES